VTIGKEGDSLLLDLRADQSGGGDQLVDAVTVHINQRHPDASALRTARPEFDHQLGQWAGTDGGLN
jgi:hypothetical protein